MNDEYELTNTWWRVGMTIPMFPWEMEILKHGNQQAIFKLLLLKWDAGYFELDGETYMPATVAEELGLPCDLKVNL